MLAQLDRRVYLVKFLVFTAFALAAVLFGSAAMMRTLSVFASSPVTC